MPGKADSNSATGPLRATMQTTPVCDLLHMRPTPALILCWLSLSLAGPGWFDRARANNGAQLAAQVAAPIDYLAALAQQVAQSDPVRQWDFVIIALDAQLEIYRRELSDAGSERLSDPQRRAKLARWRQATADLVARLERSRLRLFDGASFSLLVDPQRQIFILIDGQPIALSATRPEAEQRLANQVITGYCAYNDCSGIDAALQATREQTQPESGSWLLRQYAPPAFEVTDDVRCQFDDVAQRAEKAEACRRVTNEILDLADAIELAQDHGYAVDWQWLEGAQPTHGDSGRVLIDAGGAYLRLRTRWLSRMDRDDWRRLVDWLRYADDLPILVIRRAPQATGAGRYPP